MKWLNWFRNGEAVETLIIMGAGLAMAAAAIGVWTLYALYFWFSRITGVHLTLF